MADVQLIDPDSGQVYDVDESQAEAAAAANRLVPATPEQVAEFDRERVAEDRSGGFGSQLLTAGEEALRAGAAVADLIPGVDAGAAPPGLTELEPGQQENPLTGLYGPEARERREVNPTAAALGGATPAVAAGVLLPGAGAAGIAATLGLDAATGYAQEAVDAELEGRGISGATVLRNGVINGVFSLGAAGLGVAARQSLRGGRSVIEWAAQRASGVKGARAAAAEGEDLVEAMADPAAAESLMTALGRETETIVDRTARELESVKPAKVANNPNAQREALEAIVDAFELGQPKVAADLRKLQHGTAASRLEGLRELRARIGDDSPMAGALDGVLGREDLWGRTALDQAAAVEAALKLRPGASAGGDELLGYAEALRKVPGLEKQADDLAGLVERGVQARIASTIPRQRPAIGSVGARSDREAASMRVEQIAAFQDDAAITDAWSKAALGAPGTGERGAFERAFGGWRERVTNAEKRRDFATGLPADDATRGRLDAERLAMVDELESAAKGLKTQGADAAATRVANSAKALREVSIEHVPGALDRAKQNLDDLHMNSWRQPDVYKGENVRALVDPVVERARRALEDPSLVGARNAELQQGRNAAWSGENGFIRANQRLEANGIRFFKRIERDYNTGEWALELDVNGVRRLLALDEFEANQALPHLATMTDAMGRMLDNMVESGVAKLDDIAETKAAIGELQELGHVIEQRLIARRMTSGGPAAGVGRAWDFATGLLPGKAGEALRSSGAVAGAKARAQAVVAARTYVPETTSEAMSRLRKMAGMGAGAAAVGGVMLAGGEARAAELDALIAMNEALEAEAGLTARLMVNPDAARRYLRVAGDTVSPLDRFRGDNETPRQAFDGYRTMIEGFAQRPEQLVNLMTEEFAGVASLSPRLQREMVEQATRVAGYLQRHLPGRRNVSVVYPQGTPASNMEIRQFALRFGAATDPASVFQDARAGRLQKVQLDTLQELWPRDYTALRTAALTELGSGRATTSTRQSLSILFGFGSGVDPALGPRTRAIVAAAREAQESQAATGRPSAAMQKRQSLPSKAGLTPGGIASLQLGQSLTF